MIGSNIRVSGGITRVVKNYIQAGLGQKVNLNYFPTYYGGHQLINIVYFTFQYIKLYLLLNVLRRHYDVSHIHMSYKGSFVRKRLVINLLSKKSIPIVLHMHGSKFKDYYNDSSESQKETITNTLNKASLILALGEQWKKYYETICSSKVISFDNAVFPKEMKNNLTDKRYITTMGVLSNRKGTYDLLKVAATIKGQLNNKYKFLLAGDGEIEKVKKRIDQLGLTELFEITGWISNDEKIDEIYRNSIIYVLPSYNEGMPMSILEAMSYGLPIISTNVGSIPMVIGEENGYITEPGDIGDIGKKIIKLLNDESSLNSMRTNNINKIKKFYSINSSLEKLISLYRELIDKNK